MSRPSDKKFFSTDGKLTELGLTEDQLKVMRLLEPYKLQQNAVQVMWVEQGQPQWALAYIQGMWQTAKHCWGPGDMADAAEASYSLIAKTVWSMRPGESDRLKKIMPDVTDIVGDSNG